jgi:hypothetical protein
MQHNAGKLAEAKQGYTKLLEQYKPIAGVYVNYAILHESAPPIESNRIESIRKNTLQRVTARDATCGNPNLSYTAGVSAPVRVGRVGSVGSIL